MRLIFEVSGVEVGSIHRPKIDQQIRTTWEGILASIFDRIWWAFGSKLGWKVERRPLQKGIGKIMEKKERLQTKVSQTLRSLAAGGFQGPEETHPNLSGQSLHPLKTRGAGSSWTWSGLFQFHLFCSDLRLQDLT